MSANRAWSKRALMRSSFQRHATATLNAGMITVYLEGVIYRVSQKKLYTLKWLAKIRNLTDLVATFLKNVFNWSHCRAKISSLNSEYKEKRKKEDSFQNGGKKPGFRLASPPSAIETHVKSSFSHFLNTQS